MDDQAHGSGAIRVIEEVVEERRDGGVLGTGDGMEEVVVAVAGEEGGTAMNHNDGVTDLSVVSTPSFFSSPSTPTPSSSTDLHRNRHRQKNCDPPRRGGRNDRSATTAVVGTRRGPREDTEYTGWPS